MTAPSETVLAVIEEAGGQPLGRVRFGAQGALTLLDAVPAHQDQLATAVAETNARKSLRITVPPPRGAERTAIYAMDVERTDPDLLDVMQTLFRQRYGLVLVPSGADAAGS